MALLFQALLQYVTKMAARSVLLTLCSVSTAAGGMQIHIRAAGVWLLSHWRLSVICHLKWLNESYISWNFRFMPPSVFLVLWWYFWNDKQINKAKFSCPDIIAFCHYPTGLPGRLIRFIRELRTTNMPITNWLNSLRDAAGIDIMPETSFILWYILENRENGSRFRLAEAGNLCELISFPAHFVHKFHS